MEKTLKQFDAIIDESFSLYSQKLKDYGTAWRILRLPSLTDQIFIKANRIRSIQTKGEQKIEDSIKGEFIGVLNYSLMALIQLDLGIAEEPDLSVTEAEIKFKEKATEARDLMEKKNHDYGEAWRSMRISSITDMILQKLLRVKQIEDNQGKTLVSEGLDANYLDMINYAIFALILIEEYNI